MTSYICPQCASAYDEHAATPGRIGNPFCAHVEFVKMLKSLAGPGSDVHVPAREMVAVAAKPTYRIDVDRTLELPSLSDADLRATLKRILDMLEQNSDGALTRLQRTLRHAP